MASTKRSIVMAVDFGSTYSGVAWAQTSNVSTFPAEALSQFSCLTAYSLA